MCLDLKKTEKPSL